MKKLTIVAAAAALALVSACSSQSASTSTSGAATTSAAASASASASAASPEAVKSSPAAAESSAAAGSYTLAEVAEHATAEDCWVAIDGKVYDLTGWVAVHPGGAEAISSLCGTDGTAAFQGKHAGEEDPAAALENYLLGELAA